MIRKFTSIHIYLAFVILFFSSACARVFYSPDSTSLAHNQKIIAIIPPTISIAASKKIDGNAIKEQQATESVNFQSNIYSWMLKWKTKGKLTQEIQEVENTNAKLKKAGYPDTPLTTAELCEVLNVDGIITSNFALSKPISEGGAIAIGILTGVSAATNEVHASLSISDCNNKTLIWNYEYALSGSVGSSPSRIVDVLMKKASKKMPYFK